MEQPNPSKAPASLISEENLADMVAMAAGTPAGCFVEVGVFQGGSAVRLQAAALAQARELYLYDTFTGIPYAGELDSHQVGDFNQVDLEAIRAHLPHAKIVVGIFPASAVPMPGVAFAHLDCDQYQSVRESAEYLESRMVKGGVMWFDDSTCLAGAFQAVYELYGERLQLSRRDGKHFVVF